MLRCRLEAAGLTAYIRDEYTVQMNWMLSNAVGGVSVEVADEDLEAAREIMNLPQVETDEPPQICPSCGSVDVSPLEWPRRLAFLSLLLVRFPLLVSRKHFKCAKCHHSWV